MSIVHFRRGGFRLVFPVPLLVLPGARSRVPEADWMILRHVRNPRPFPWFAVLLALGLGLRFYHYIHNHVVWHDEAALINNVLAKSVQEYFGPLYYSEAAPPLFLGLEKVAALTLGTGTYSLRLVPFVATCVAFVALAFMARRVLPAAAVPWFVLLLATSDRLLWHACEAKPYAIDVLIACGLLATLLWPAPHETATEQQRQSALLRRLLVYAALCPILIFLSFPACFLLGAVALAWLPELLRVRRPHLFVLYGVFLVLLGGSFLLLLTGPVRAQRDTTLLDCWQSYFPSWDQPWRIPGSLVMRLTEVFRYAAEPVGNLLAVPAVFGAVVLWHTGQRRVLAFLLLPLGMTAFAWLAGQYPFGATRVMVFSAPAALYLIAAGLPAMFAWLVRHIRFASVLLAVVLLVPAGQAAYRIAVPWLRLDSAEPAAFVLRHRRADEPVLGTLWEHTYYFHNLGPLYRQLRPPKNYPPTLPELFDCQTGHVDDEGRHVTGLWVVGLPGEVERPDTVQGIPPAGSWAVVERFVFKDMTVLHLQRKNGTAGDRVVAVGVSQEAAPTNPKEE
jgi:hypothetical protein